MPIENIIALVCTMASFFFLPAPLLLVINTGVFIILFAWQWALRRPLFLSGLLVLVYVSLGLGAFLFGVDRVFPYTGSFFYGVLSLGFLFRGLSQPKPPVHLLPAAGFALAWLCSVFLFPHLAYIVAPIVFATAGNVAGGIYSRVC